MSQSNIIVPAKVTLHTNGQGWWTVTAKAVVITGFSLGYISEEADFGELCVHFNTKSWNVKTNGLIYSDTQFGKELRAYLNSIGLDANDVSYSEQGMQTETYVSCDVGKAFLDSFKSKFPKTFMLAHDKNKVV